MNNPRILLLLLAWLISCAAFADERILSFHSDITVFSNRVMEVRETIKVRAEGNEIKRGIYRDFPTDYRDRYGNNVRVDFGVVAVQRDGRAEAYFTQRRDNGVRVYIGSEDIFLRSGEYTYTLIYRTDRQLGFFEDRDELYWNVTGNGWVFAIDKASASVRLPAAIPPESLHAEAYTGPSGSRARDYSAEVDPFEPVTHFVTTAPLRSQEGLTIVVTWPKGYIPEPTTQEQMDYLLADNQHLLYGLTGLLFLNIYYFLVWRRFGKDPEPGVIIPHYVPPPNYSPASARFISRMGYDHKTFAAALISLAVKGMISISSKKSEFSLSRSAPAHEPPLSPCEKAIMKTLFNGQDTIALKNDNHEVISAAIEAHKQLLKKEYEKVYFLTNSLWIIPGVLLTIAAMTLIFLLVPVSTEVVAATLWLSVWSFGVGYLALRTYTAWKAANSFMGYTTAVLTTLFSIPFLAVELFVLYMLSSWLSAPMAFIMVATVATNFMYFHWLKAPTLAGRRLLDRLEGFRLYLSVAEKDELKFRYPPEKTPELFERYLPYALALDVEQPWAERFSRIFAELHGQGKDYHPDWYHGRHWNHHDMGAFGKAVGSSLSSAISSSSTAPGSSSGSDGGSSGGGGGGGGGGGW